MVGIDIEVGSEAAGFETGLDIVRSDYKGSVEDLPFCTIVLLLLVGVAGDSVYLWEGDHGSHSRLLLRG